MKYIVTLRKILEKKVVVEGKTIEEADQKLLVGDTVFEAERTISEDCYQGWAYSPDEQDGVDKNCLPVDEDDAIICNLEDFAKWYSCDSVEGLERALFKHTECGMCYDATNEAITLVGYVEGADCDGPSETLAYPFTGKEVRAVMARLEEKADEMWHEWNVPSEEDE